MFIMSCHVQYILYLLDEYYIYNVCFDFFACKEFEKLRNWYNDDTIIESALQMPENSQSCIKNVIFTPKGVEVEKSIWECFLLDATRDDIITPVKVQEEVKSKVQKTEVHTTINSGTVLCQSTLYIVEWNCWWHNPI